MKTRDIILDIQEHMKTLNEEHGDLVKQVVCLKTDVAVVKNDIKWMKSWGLAILVIIQIVVSLVASLIISNGK